jgi:hypothetical protein
MDIGVRVDAISVQSGARILAHVPVPVFVIVGIPGTVPVLVGALHGCAGIHVVPRVITVCSTAGFPIDARCGKPVAVRVHGQVLAVASVEIAAVLSARIVVVAFRAAGTTWFDIGI